ncbi:unnamed protein product, partial [Leptidea sinapis]
ASDDAHLDRPRH